MAGFGSGGATYTLAAKVQSSGIGQFRSALSGAKGTVGKFTKAISGASAVLGGSLVAGFGAAVNEARQFQDSMVELEKVAGEETAEEMSGAIKEMAETIPLGQSALADISSDAARFGVRGPENIRSFTEAVSKMSVATNLSAESAGESLAKLAELTGTPIDSVENLGSSINKLSNTFATSSQEITDSMLRSSAALSQLGVSQTDIAGLSAALNAVSESSSRAGSRMRRLAQEMVDPGTVGDLAAAFGKNTDEFKSMVEEDPTGTIVQMAEAMEQGGARADSLRSALSSTSEQALAGLSQNLDGVNRALDSSAKAFEENTSLQSEFETATSTLSSQLTLVENRVRNIAISVGEKLLPILTDLLKRTKPVLSRVEDFASGLSRAQVEAAAAGSVIATFAGTVGWFAGGPLGLAVGALGTLTYKMVQHREEIQSSLLPIYEAIVEEVAATRESFRQLGAAAEPALRPIRSAVDRVSGAVETATGSVESDIQTGIIGSIRRAGRVVRAVLGRATAAFTEHGTAIGETITSTYNSARDTVSQGLGRIETLWDDHGGTVERHASTAYGKAKSTADTALSTLQSEVLTPAFDAVEGLWDKHGGAVEETVGDMATAIKEDPVGALQKTLDLIPGPLSDFGSAFISTFDNIKENSIPRFESAISGIGDSVQQAADGNIDEALGSLNSAFEDTLSGTRIALVGEGGKGGIVGNMLEGTRKSLETAASGIATAAGKGLHKPIVTAIEETATAIIGGPDGSGEGLVDKFIGEIATFFKSDAWKQLAGAAGTMLGKGIRFVFEENFNTLMWNDKSIIKSLFNSMADYIMTDALGDISEALGILVDSAMAFFTNLADELIHNSVIKDLFSSIADYIKNDAASDLLSAAKTAGEAIWNGIKDKFNSLMPNSLSIPGFDVGGQSVGIPNILGGGSVSVPKISTSGFDVDLPQLQTGGLIEDEGLAQLHEGELVVPAAQVDRDVGDGGGKTFVNHGGIQVHADTDDPEEFGEKLVAEVDARF